MGDVSKKPSTGSKSRHAFAEGGGRLLFLGISLDGRLSFSGPRAPLAGLLRPGRPQLRHQSPPPLHVDEVKLPILVVTGHRPLR